jgi:hypothetical protein
MRIVSHKMTSDSPSTNDSEKEKRFVPRQDAANTAIYASSFLVYQSAMRMITHWKDQGVHTAKETIEVARHYIQQYPALKTFLYSTALLSAVPIGIFSLCFGISLMISIGTAIAGVLVVQSSVALIGMSILVPVEIGIVCLAGGATLLLQGTGAQKLLDYPEKVMTRYESFLVKENSQDTIVME